MNKKILNFCLEKGLLIDNELLDLFSETDDLNIIKNLLENIKKNTKQRIITKNIIFDNKESLNNIISSLPLDNKQKLEKLKIKLGLSIEISKETKISSNFNESKENSFSSGNVKVNSDIGFNNKKLEVKDFVNYFKNRLFEMKNVLQENSSLDNLVSINKISSNRKNLSLIGIVSEKRITKNKNIIFEVEDLTGKISILINKDKKELFKKAELVALDSVLGFKCSGNKDFLFCNDIIFPDLILPERRNSIKEEYALFIGDLHIGSKNFMKENFLKFIKYLNGEMPNTPEVDKIKYLFIVGDVVTGVGNYPNQEKDLEIKDLEEQFIQLSNFLSKIRKDIKIVISPGNHDGVRLMEPQPLFDEKFAWPLYDMENVILTTNPSNINIGSLPGFSGFNVLTYHGFSFFYYADNVSELILKKAAHSPNEIMKYLLMNRHLSPTHRASQYFPGEKDHYFIKEIPDIFVTGHLHKSSVSYYNNILMISVSSWEEMSDYMEKVGAKPDFCKVPMFNLKTRAVKILDFE